MAGHRVAGNVSDEERKIRGTQREKESTMGEGKKERAREYNLNRE